MELLLKNTIVKLSKLDLFRIDRSAYNVFDLVEREQYLASLGVDALPLQSC